ncbi:hypothetical protein HDE_01295 [Halotydeus destructor]|nr:hypothetical protein HDE_01295 [Halotydeus destructor]
MNLKPISSLMMTHLFAFVTLIFTTSLAASIQDRCNKDVSSCLKDIVQIMNDSRIAFAQDEKQLDLLCRHFNHTVVCVNDFILHCMGTEMQAQYNVMISGSLDLIKKLCVRSSDFRNRYLRHANCYHEQADDYRKCAQVYNDNEKERIETVRLNQNHTLELQLWCCNYDAHRTCTRDAVEDACGHDAADLAEQIVVTGGGDIVATHCSNYTVKSGSCPSLFSSLSSASTSLSSSFYYHDKVSSLLQLPILFNVFLFSFFRLIKFA